MIWSGAGCLAWALAGCTVKNIDPNASANGASASGDVRAAAATIPAAFKFETSRSVQLTLSADKSLFNAKGVAAIEVTNTANALLFQGPIRVGQPLVVRLAVPTKDNSVNVTFRTQGVELNSSTTIASNTAAHTFQ
jgi:hypothetical protein